jgi:uncharacterized protein YndB with AHSA1/START domain
MKPLKGILYGLIGLVALVLAAGLFLPRHAHVERSIVTSASPATVFEIVNGFTRFNEWSPWAQLDPNTKYTYSGPETGVGSRMEWSSKRPEVGTGSQEVIAIDPDRRVTNAIDFGAQGKGTATIGLEPVAAGTRITWSLDTDFEHNYFGRYFGPLMDRFVGADYEKGLARLKELAEASTPADAPAVSPTDEDATASTAAVASKGLPTPQL